MKKNLIIIVFCLFMLGTFCFNYSYAKTVTRTDAFCKNIIKEDAITDAIGYTYNESEIPQTVKEKAKNLDKENQKEYYQARRSANKSTQIENTANELEKACIEAGCYYIGSKCLSCDGIKLNTNVPFIGNCIPSDSQSEAFPLFIGGLIKFAMSLLMLAGFLCILIGGVMITAGKTADGKNLIMKVVRALAALGASGVILKIINPNFFS